MIGTARAAAVFIAASMLGGCGRAPRSAAPAAKAYGAALVEVSGSKQADAEGMNLDQPLVVQVNDAQGNAVEGALVSIQAPGGAACLPCSGLTGADGQFTASVTLGEEAGHYRIVAATRTKAGLAVELPLDEIALGYQQVLGRQLNRDYCARCHDPESTPERVSNRDNLNPLPHAFNEGAVLNAITSADMTSIIAHGGPALNRSAAMPPYAYTLSKADIDALIAYIRAVADPPYRPRS